MRRRRSFGIVVALALVVAACSHGGDKGSTTPTTSRARKDGGGLVIAVDQEAAGLNPSQSLFSPTALTYGYAVFDPLMARDAKGNVVPYLAKSLAPDPTFKVWRLELRAGITFHDGEPLTASAVAQQLQGYLSSVVAKQVFRDVESVVVLSDLLVEIRMKQPWSTFPNMLTGQFGFVAAPKMLADPAGDSHPIGTGPFVLQEWLPGEHFVATKNPAYWRAKEGLPHLDRVEIRPITDSAARVQALRAGDVDVVQSTDAATIAALKKVTSAGIVSAAQRGGAGTARVLVLNTATAPFDRVACRRAVDEAIDRKKLANDAESGVSVAADGTHDAGKAKADAASCGAFELRTTGDPADQRVAKLLRQAWSDAGLKVTVATATASQLQLDALLGRFQVMTQHVESGADPATTFAAIDSANALPVGTPAVNFGRYQSTAVDKLALEARATDDAKTQRAREAQIAAILARDLPIVRLTETAWFAAWRPGAQDVTTDVALPGATRAGALSGALRVAALHRARR